MVIALGKPTGFLESEDKMTLANDMGDVPQELQLRMNASAEDFAALIARIISNEDPAWSINSEIAQKIRQSVTAHSDLLREAPAQCSEPIENKRGSIHDYDQIGGWMQNLVSQMNAVQRTCKQACELLQYRDSQLEQLQQQLTEAQQSDEKSRAMLHDRDGIISDLQQQLSTLQRENDKANSSSRHGGREVYYSKEKLAAARRELERLDAKQNAGLESSNARHKSRGTTKRVE